MDTAPSWPSKGDASDCADSQHQIPHLAALDSGHDRAQPRALQSITLDSMLTGRRFCRALALVYALVLPVGESVRRFPEVRAGTVYWPSVLDDYLIAAFLLAGWLATRRNFDSGRALLAAAWGFTVAFGYASFFGHLKGIEAADAGPLPHRLLISIIGVGWALAIVALIATLRTGGPSHEGRAARSR